MQTTQANFEFQRTRTMEYLDFLKDGETYTFNPNYLEDTYFDEDNYSSASENNGRVCDLEEGIQFEAVFIPVLYFLAFVVGLLGNGLLLGVLAQRRRTWSVTDTFILHLGVTDILLLLTLPVWAIQYLQGAGWTFGTPFCKITGALFMLNFYCGIFLLACISLDRYLSIVHATHMYNRRKPWLVQASCLLVWLFALFLTIPDWIFLEAKKDPRIGKTECIHNYDISSVSEWRLASRLLYHTVGFLLPLVVLVYCYSCILLKLQKGSQGFQKQRAVRVILALVVVFFVHWTPYNITLMVDTLQANNTIKYSCEGRTALSKALTITSSLGYLHCSVNPILYAFVGVKFRRQLMDILRSLGCKIKGGVKFHSTQRRRSSTWSTSGDTSNSIAI